MYFHLHIWFFFQFLTFSFANHLQELYSLWLSNSITSSDSSYLQVGETLLQLVDETSDPTRSIDSLGSLKILDSDSTGIEDCNSPSRESNCSRVLSTPPVRNLAKEYGIDINDVHGTGKDGRILKEDVLKYAAGRGIIKESPTSFGSAPTEQSQERDKIHPGGSFAFGLEFKDTKITLRYYHSCVGNPSMDRVDLDISPTQFLSDHCKEMKMAIIFWFRLL